MNNSPYPTYIRMLRRKEVESLTGLKKSTIYEKIIKGTFPKQHNIGLSRSVFWLEKEIYEWIAQQVQDSREKTA